MKIYIISAFIFAFCLQIKGQNEVSYAVIGNTSDEELRDMDTLKGVIYIAGNTNECGSSDGMILKYRKDTVLKRKNIGTWDVEVLTSIRVTNTDTLFIGGYGNVNADYNIYVAKLDTNLNIIKDKYIDLDDWNFCNDLAIGNGFIIGAGENTFNGTYDPFFFKLDYNLDTIWTNTVTLPLEQKISKIIQYNDSIFIACGYTKTDTDGKDVLLISVNSNTGDTLWTNNVGGNRDDFANSIIKTSDGGIAGFGTTSSFNSTNEDTYLFKTDSSGDFLWSNLHQVQSSANVYNDRGIDLVELQNGDLIVAAISRSYGSLDIQSTMIMRTNSNGDWQNGFIYDGGEDDYPVRLIKEDDTTLYVGGINNSLTHGYKDLSMLLFKNVIPNISVQTKDIELTPLCFVSVEDEIKKNISVYPNPVIHDFVIEINDNSALIEVSLSNLTGQIIYNRVLYAGDRIMFPKNVARGVYLLTIKHKEQIYRQKIVYAKQ